MKSLWETLKAIGINLPRLKEITVLKFSSLVHIDKSVKIEGGATVVINPDRLSGKQKRALKGVLKTQLLPQAGAVLSDTSAPTVDAAIEVLPAIQDASRELLPIIPARDIPLLNACLFLRATFESGAPVEDLKAQIVRVYGTRGRNFANLCTAGYLEQWFMPLYEELRRTYPDDAAEAAAKFQTLYNSIVNDLPWTEFVSSRASAATIADHIKEKMKRNIELGVRYLNVHGLGDKNVRKVMLLLPDIEKQTGAIAVRIDRDPTRIFVRLEIPPLA